MKTILAILVFVFLIGCAVQEPVITEVALIEPEIIITPEPVVQEPVPELVVEPVSEPVELTPDLGLPVITKSKVRCANPERYTYIEGYCVENECQDKSVKCIPQGNRIMRPECECWIYYGNAVCSIKGGERTRVKSPLCTRRGQAGRICAAYDSNKRQCVNF